MSGPRLLGAVLAGGEGRRFGGPKAEAPVGGIPMVERAVATVREVVDDVVVVTARPLESPPAPVVRDRVPGQGPLGGLDAALRAARERGLDGVLLVACDLPLLTPDLLRRVVAGLGDHAAVAPQRDAGGVEPLCAAYRGSTLAVAEARLEMEDRSLHSFFRAVGGHVIPSWRLGAPGSTFLNVNTPADKVRAEEAMRRPLPAIVCVVGKKKSGKTLTAVGLIAALAARGYRVMSAKHGHGFELDTPGTDSYRHRHEGGAHRVVMAGPEQVAVMGGWGSGGELPLEELVARYLSDADVVVAEGFKTSGAAKIEVYRRAAHERALWGGDPARDATYLAILTDVPGFAASVPVLDVDDPERFRRLADLVETRLLGAGAEARPQPREAP
ncbi:MAG: hypothetical protein AMXMBFR53_16100 [Gemmatimonadota bacterium]